MATWACVRALPWKVPMRSARQFGQAQFHWGNPPPAAEPRTFTRIRVETAKRSSHYSSALAYELISQFRSISSCFGVVHSMVKLLEEKMNNCRTRIARPSGDSNCHKYRSSLTFWICLGRYLLGNLTIT